MSTGPDAVARWSPGRPVDIRRTLAPLVRGAGDPSHRIGDGRFWRTSLTVDGPVTLSLHLDGGTVVAEAWGPGADCAIAGVPALLGEGDDWSELDVGGYPGLVRILRSYPGLRLLRTGRVLEALAPAVIEQRVTGLQARRSWRALLLRYGAPAPGPAPVGMRVPPPASVLLDVPAWWWSRYDVDLARLRALRAAAAVAARLEECCDLSSDAALARLQVVPGIGVWTAAEVAQRALGHPDAVSVNDYHVHNQVVFALTGRPRGSDEEMLELLSPWLGQRQRVIRLIEVAGIRAPRFGPRQSLDRPRGA
ncbi:MAG: DNA-3-methyladenine glycosylase 2 family protein [bacterium]